MYKTITLILFLLHHILIKVKFIELTVFYIFLNLNLFCLFFLLVLIKNILMQNLCMLL